MSRTQGNGRIGSKVGLQQLVEPTIVPPPPISWYLRGITTRKVEMMINDLLEEAGRIKVEKEESDRFLSKNSQRWHGKMSSPKVTKENKHQIRETEHLLKLLMSSFSVNQRFAYVSYCDGFAGPA
nr:hypothetical protein [Tanacetum cinerariifolium]